MGFAVFRHTNDIAFTIKLLNGFVIRKFIKKRLFQKSGTASFYSVTCLKSLPFKRFLAISFYC